MKTAIGWAYRIRSWYLSTTYVQISFNNVKPTEIHIEIILKSFKLRIQCQHNSDLCWFTSCYSFDFRMPNFSAWMSHMNSIWSGKKGRCRQSKVFKIDVYFYRIYYYAPYLLKVEIYQGNNAIVGTILPHLYRPS